MPSSTVNICVFSLVLLCFHQICHCSPNRNIRGLVKDYFVPDTLVFASDKFEKGDDGKYYLKQSAYRRDSEVDYISADSTGKKTDVLPDVGEIETVKDDSKTVQSANIKTGLSKKEQSEKEVEHASTSEVVKQTKEVSEKMDNDGKKAPFIPVNPKFTAPPKPDAKDEVSFKTDLPPTESKEKVEEKITIGQIPDLYSRLLPAPENSDIPILIPIRQISYRTMKIIPIPPTGVSDRLPIPYEDDIVGEGAHESESEEVPQPPAERENGYPFVNPLMSLLSFHNILKDLKEADKEDVGKESQVVDVLGKKFLMQSNVMKYPANDNSHTYIRFMSVKPLDELNPKEPKTVEDALKKEIEVEERKAVDIEKEESGIKEKVEVNEEKVEVKEENVMTESEAKKETEKKLLEETEEKLTKTDILKAEETELKVKIEKNVPKEVIIKNTDEKKIDDEMETNKSSEEILKGINIPQSEIEMAEKAESRLKLEEVEKNDEAEEKTKTQRDESVVMKDEKGKEKIEAVEAIARKYEDEKMNMGSKKDIFLLEKKKKEKTFNEEEEANKKKKSRKKKKCKCEEKDSESDDDADE